MIRTARIAHRDGVPFRIAWIIAKTARNLHVSTCLAFALVEQESGFRHIFGHDAGGPFAGQRVTRRRYRKLVAWVRRGGTSNGVGLTQITYGGYLLAAPGIWRKRANVKFGLGLIKQSIREDGLRAGLAIYNGGPANPQYVYADQVLDRMTKWRSRFAKPPRKRGKQ